MDFEKQENVKKDVRALLCWGWAMAVDGGCRNCGRVLCLAAVHLARSYEAVLLLAASCTPRPALPPPPAPAPHSPPLSLAPQDLVMTFEAEGGEFRLVCDPKSLLCECAGGAVGAARWWPLRSQGAAASWDSNL